jgi:ferredoxin
MDDVMNDLECVIAFFSPSGATGRLAGVLEAELQQEGITSHIIDLGKGGDGAELIQALKQGRQTLLMIGSPVYKDMAAPPVMNLIERLPEADGEGPRYALPFVTWGGVTSGVALWQMARELEKKGFNMPGAAKVPAVHSLMWDCEDPMGKGHPDEEDELAMAALVLDVLGIVKKGGTESLSPEDLDHHDPEQAAEMKRKIENRPSGIPKTLDPEACTRCGFCETECPVGAVTLDPDPVFGPDCVDCLTCLRVCPEGAIQVSALDEIHTRIRKRASSLKEPLLTWVFLNSDIE